MRPHLFTTLLLILILPCWVQAANVDLVDKEQINAADEMISQKRTKVRNLLDLSEVDQEKFWKEYGHYEEEMRGSIAEFITLLDKFINNENLTDKEANKLIDDIIEVHKNYLELDGKYIKIFRKMLPRDQLLNLISIMIST